jgi:aminoglycoside phosphotransferase (APT) family kinase protein
VIDLGRLGEWMDANGLLGMGEPIGQRFISGGSQNEIYEIRRGGERCVIRIPPQNAPLDRDKGILREWRIVEALRGTDVPHAPAIAVCSDVSVLGRPFYLMGFVEGWSPLGRKKWPKPFDTDLKARAGLGYQLVEGIALSSRLDWRARGLEDFGHPENFHERQVDRWTSLFETFKVRELEGMDTTSSWLRAHRPIDYIPGLMHGDYQFANVMFNDGAPAKLAAIVDWEMGTIGDPKLDLGWMIHSWPTDTSTSEASTASYVDLRGMPNRSQILAYYSDLSGRQVDDIDYYAILAKWKLAIILERGFARAGDDERLLGYGPVIVDCMRSAADLAESTDYGG